MKKYLIILFALISTLLYAETNEVILEKISNHSRSLKSIESDFTQVNASIYLNVEKEVEGKFYYKAEDKVCLKNDDKNFILMNEGDFLVSTDGNLMRASKKSSPMVSELGLLLKSCITGDYKTILQRRNTSLSIAEDDSYYVLNVQMGGSAKRYFSDVLLTYSKKDLSLYKLKLQEANGSYITYTFNNQKFNTEIDLSVFNVD